MKTAKIITSLADLEQLLPESKHQQHSTEPPNKILKHDGKQRVVHVSLDTKGRKGKIVTLVTGLQHNPQTIDNIARILKQQCGAGGTVKEGNIEIQGDQRERVKDLLREMNYTIRQN